MLSAVIVTEGIDGPFAIGPIAVWRIWMPAFAAVM